MDEVGHFTSLQTMSGTSGLLLWMSQGAWLSGGPQCPPQRQRWPSSRCPASLTLPTLLPPRAGDVAQFRVSLSTHCRLSETNMNRAAGTGLVEKSKGLFCTCRPIAVMAGGGLQQQNLPGQLVGK